MNTHNVSNSSKATEALLHEDLDVQEAQIKREIATCNNKIKNLQKVMKRRRIPLQQRANQAEELLTLKQKMKELREAAKAVKLRKLAIVKGTKLAEESPSQPSAETGLANQDDDELDDGSTLEAGSAKEVEERPKFIPVEQLQKQIEEFTKHLEALETKDSEASATQADLLAILDPVRSLIVNLIINISDFVDTGPIFDQTLDYLSNEVPSKLSKEVENHVAIKYGGLERRITNYVDKEFEEFKQAKQTESTGWSLIFNLLLIWNLALSYLVYRQRSTKESEELE